MEQDTQKNIEIQNEELYRKLTKRNEQYMMSLDKALDAANLTEDRKREIYSEMLPVLVEGQKTGQTARQLYGTVSEQIGKVLDGPRKAEANAPSKDWMIFVDGGLMMVALMSLVMGATGLIGKSQGGSEMGIATLALNFIGGGLVVLLIAKNTPNRDGSNKKKGGIFRYILVVGAAMMAWLLIMTFSMAFLPASINIILPPIGYLIVAAVAFAGKMYFKKTFNVRGGIF